MSSQSQFQSRQHVHALFAQGREVASNAAKGLGTRQAAEATRNFLLDFKHAKITLGLRIVERNVQALQEAQHRFLVFAESVEQIASGTLFAPFGWARIGSRRWRIGLIAFLQERVILGFPIGDFSGIKPLPTALACLFDGGVHVREQRLHGSGPGLLLLFVQEGQFSQVMDITQSMSAGKLPVGGPSIMQTHPIKGGENANVIQRFFAPFSVHAIMGQMGSGSHMHPPALAHNVHPTFIGMQHISLLEMLFDLFFNGLQVGGAALDQGFEGANRHGWPKEILDGCAGTLIGQELLLRQIDSNRSKGWSILDRSGDPCRKGSFGDTGAVRADFLLGLVLNDQQPFWGHIQDLTAFELQGHHRLQIGLALRTRLDLMHDDLIGSGHLKERIAFMACLCPWLLLALFAQAFGFLLARKAIRGGRQVAIVAIFGQALFNLLQSGLLVRHLLTQFLIFCSQRRVFRAQGSIFFSKVMQFFFLSHAATLLLFLPFGKGLADLNSYGSEQLARPASASLILLGCPVRYYEYKLGDSMSIS